MEPIDCSVVDRTMRILAYYQIVACVVMISTAVTELCFFSASGLPYVGVKVYSVVFILVCTAFVGFMLYKQAWRSMRFLERMTLITRVGFVILLCVELSR